MFGRFVSSDFGTSWRRGLVMMMTLAGVLTLTSDRSQAAQPLYLKYEAYFGGLHAMDINLQVDRSPQDYEISLEARLTGFISNFFSFEMASRAAGMTGEEGPRPKRFRTQNVWQGKKERWVEISYGSNGSLQVAAEPPAQADDRDKVPESYRLGTMDPMSGFLAIVETLSRSGDCSNSVEVFDGRRRYDLVTQDRGAKTLAVSAYAPYGGPATHCRLALKQVTGFWKKEHLKKRYPEEIDLYLTQVEPGAPLLPIRLEAENPFGAIRVHLVHHGSEPPPPVE